MSLAYISMGSNMGSKLAYLQAALDKIKALKGTGILAASSVYRTAPVGYTEQDWFLNAVAKLKTTLSARELLLELLTIEHQLGRERTIRWGPRVIDLDLLIYDNVVIDEPDMMIPHPRLQERAFVLVPLMEIDPELELPSGVKINQLLKGIDYQKEIFKISESLSCK